MNQLRIAIAGISHETNTFASWPTNLADFEANRCFRGEKMLELAGTNTVIGGALGAIGNDQTLAPILLTAASAIPGGIVTTHAFEQLMGEIDSGLRHSRPDAVVLDLHGAMVTENNEDGDAAVLARVRGAVGPDIPVSAVLDLHANVSQAMVDLADVLVLYDSYPHIDSAERGSEAVRLATSAARREVSPVSSLVKLPMLPPGPKQFSHVEPTKSIVEKAKALELRAGVLKVGVAFAFPYADCPFPGMSVVVTTDGDKSLADRTAQELADEIWARREEFRPESLSVEAAVHAAMSSAEGPVVLADLGDNPGGGSAGDGTALLWALLDLGAQDAAFATIADEETVAAAFAAGPGTTIEIDLGAKRDELHGYPITVEATVQSLSNGEFTYEGPMNTGARDTLGRTAVLRCHGRYDNAVDVVVCERRVQALDTAIFRSQGIEPTAKKILAVKSTVHFRGSFTPIAAQIIEVDTPGLTSIDFSRFPYRQMPRPIWPLDDI